VRNQPFPPFFPLSNNNKSQNAAQNVNWAKNVVPTRMALINPFAGVFPVVSYLHVPRKMPHAQWLMIGTCFLIEPPTAEIRNRAPAIFLTAAHTFIPWKYSSNPAELKIPADFRKPRYCTGNICLYDGDGRSSNTEKFAVHLAAVHPTLDVALLTLSLQDCDAFLSRVYQRQLWHCFRLMPASCPFPIGSPVTITGFRGRGRIGELDTLNEEVVKRLSKEDQAALLREMTPIEGKQDGVSCGLCVTGTGVAQQTHFQCYNGMSGAPVQHSTDKRLAIGVITKKMGQNSVGFETSTDILNWCETLFRQPEGDVSE